MPTIEKFGSIIGLKDQFIKVLKAPSLAGVISLLSSALYWYIFAFVVIAYIIGGNDLKILIDSLDSIENVWLLILKTNAALFVVLLIAVTTAITSRICKRLDLPVKELEAKVELNKIKVQAELKAEEDKLAYILNHKHLDAQDIRLDALADITIKLDMLGAFLDQLIRATADGSLPDVLGEALAKHLNTPPPPTPDDTQTENENSIMIEEDIARQIGEINDKLIKAELKNVMRLRMNRTDK